MNRRNFSRDSCLRYSTSPVILAACSWMTFFAKSTPIMIVFVTVAVLSIQWLLMLPSWHIAMPFGADGNHPIYFGRNVIFGIPKGQNP